MAAIARSLAEHGAYANPFAPVITGPTALVPPIHPLFLAGLIAIFRNSVAMSIAATFANMAANALIAALLELNPDLLFKTPESCSADALEALLSGLTASEPAAGESPLSPTGLVPGPSLTTRQSPRRTMSPAPTLATWPPTVT